METPSQSCNVAAPIAGKIVRTGANGGPSQDRAALAPPPATSEAKAQAQAGQPRVLTLRVTPLGLAIAAALVLSGLALAFSLGRRMSFEYAEPPEPPIVKTLEEIRQHEAVRYEDLDVDRGAMQSARGTSEEIIR